MKKSFISFFFGLALFFFILSFSIGLPIYFRPFYYAHITALDLEHTSGFSNEEIKQAYDDVLDYLTLPGTEFSTGVMKHSAEGEAHFSDCKALFTLNATVLVISATVLVVLLFLRKKKLIPKLQPGRFSPAFPAAISAIAFPIIIGIFASLDFDRAFIIFHKLFFPGKENWIFNPRTDEIIRVLPQTFFMNCALLIGASVLTLSAAIIIFELCSNKRKK